MKNTNIRPCNTQKLVHQKSHSRKFLSAIFNTCRYKNKDNSLFNEYVEDPRLQSSGMTLNFITARGFTLIELLVVVLIIGILAAVALPQYNKVVEKTRASEGIEIISSLEKALDLYLLEHGYPASDMIDLLNNAEGSSLNIDFPLNCTTLKGLDWCSTKNFEVSAVCYPNYCSINLTRDELGKYDNDDMGYLPGDDRLYQMYTSRYKQRNKWTRSCQENSDIGSYICKSLKSQGWN